MRGSLPELIEFQDEFENRRDDFEIVAFHDDKAADFAELDAKLAPVKAQFWGGKDLPFPILLDASGATLREYGINAFPTTLVIDPEGKVVKHGGVHHVREHLMATSKEVKHYLALLERDFDQGVAKLAKAGNQYAAYALAKFGAKSAWPEQVEPLAAALKGIGGTYAIEFFLGERGARSADKDTRLAAARTLGELCDRGYLSVLVGLLNAEPDPEVKQALLAAARRVQAK